MRNFYARKQHIVVRGLLAESDRVLIVRDTGGASFEYYELPGGYVAFGKDPVEALIDLFFEQTHIPIEVIGPFRTTSRMSPHDDVQIVEIVYRVRPREQVDIKKPTRKEMLWIEPSDASYFFSSRIMETIRSAFRLMI
jgi:8-oxo-dGTP pyrophosphatase MutT (NUDIX family)